jgi:predicted phosphodiesterase
MKTAVVGDLHGKYELVEKLLQWDHNIVFIGDYLDSFDRKAIEQIRTLDLILEAVITSDGKVKALRGNHEMAYVNPARMACSGNSNEVATALMSRDLSPLLDYLWVEDNILLTHAGVSQRLLTNLKQTVGQYIGTGQFEQIGRSRGGYDVVGGLYWCDWWQEFLPVEGIRQVVGHSAFRPVDADPGIVTKGENYNIDCLDRVSQVLIIEDGVISYDLI